MGAQCPPPQHIGGKVGQHLWTAGGERLCAPPANGDGRRKPPSQWEMGCPALPSLPLQYGPGRDAPAPAKRRTRRGARDARGRRRPPGPVPPGAAPAPWSSRRSAPTAPLPPPSRAARAGRGGHGNASRPLRGRARGAVRSPRHVTPPPPLPAAGTMAARAPRVRGRVALKGAGAGRSRDRGGHSDPAHTHTQRRHSAKSTLFRFPSFMIHVQHSQGRRTATAQPQFRGYPSTAAPWCWLQGSALFL